MTIATPDAYSDLSTFRLFINSAVVADDGDDADTALEILALEAASVAVDRACGRSFKAASGVPTARVFTPIGTDWIGPIDYYAVRQYPYIWYSHYQLPIDDVFTATGLAVAFDSTGNGDYTIPCTAFRLAPTNAPGRGLPYTKLIFDTGTYPPVQEESVQVTADWGWSAVPSTIQNATLIQAARFLKRRDAPFGVAGSPEMGNELRLLARLDPDVALLVSNFKKNWGSV